MSFFTLVLKNLLQRRSRSVLAILGIAIAIGAVVALTSMAWGFERTWVNTYEARGVDLLVAKPGGRSGMPASFSASTESELRTLPDVKEVSGVLGDVFGIEDSPAVLVNGLEPKSFLWQHLKLVQGRWPEATAKDEVVIGELAAQMLGKSVGDKIQIETEEYVVCGIFASSALAEDGSILMNLSAMQSLTERAGMINFLEIRVDPNTTAERLERLRNLIKARFKGLTALSPAEVPQANVGIQIAKAMSLATSIIAFFVGATGVMNTILMSVFERLQEIGILLAIGWRRARILRMILFESLLLGLAGGISGCVLGVAAVRALQASPWIRGKLAGDVQPSVLALGLLVALALGTLGGIYPAWIGSRMSPVTALRHE